MLFHQFSLTLRRLCPTPVPLVLAFSGGLDSRVLLHLLSRFIREFPDYSVQAVYVHHGLSPNADHWQKQCAVWAAQDGIPFETVRVEVQKGSRLSLEQSARDARYQALAGYVRKGECLLTAQHADDQLETVLLALKRGSGPAGLAAMPEMKPFAGGSHVRPLLDISRATLEAYAETHQLQWVEDESNQDTRFDRNFLRQTVLPALNERWPGLRQSVARSAALCGEQEALLAALLSEKLSLLSQPDGSLNIAVIEDAVQGKALIRLWLQQQQLPLPSKAQMEQIWLSICQARVDANPCVSLAGYDIRRFRHHLYVVRPLPDLTQWHAEMALDAWCALPAGLGQLRLSRLEAGTRVGLLLRLPAVDEPVRITFDPSGLSAQPVGRAGRRKLKKLFQESQVPSWRRRQMPLVFYGDQLAAVAGLFVVKGFEGNTCQLVWKCDHLH
ncbi:tRNA lysidine(34) synthetase TilS [Photobacterium sp. GJ3]|uniref:tRNA lysidine(34) synthetase TilS n=1 Tax=Photobacterium sp. GJ3 TaxID=2829502 RepID=UPI001B8B6B6A|nr:tRNA lysidine(34) synthetase TilS [Photobacterium sp. GJ3]QUJ66891.1 tRNA lysidine(34) synthetase TilS [Photobacterium sp. GJ3]